MITYRAFKNYQKRNHLFIAKLEQLLSDFRLNFEDKEKIEFKIRIAKMNEESYLKDYPQYNERFNRSV